MRIHLDTDFGGDTDDACALAMLLGWPDVDVVGITTNLDLDGQRAGCVAYYLETAGRTNIPLAAGAAVSLTGLERHESTWADRRYWPERVRPLPAAAGAALELLTQSIEAGATVLAIGAYTNLALLAVSRHGILDGVRVVAMGGWISPPDEGLPQWGPEMDWNVQCDVRAAEILLASGADLTLAPLPVTMRAQLRSAHLVRLQSAGALGELLARQCHAHAGEHDAAVLASSHPGLATDFVNFQYDPVACAVALGWSGATVETMSLSTSIKGGVLRLQERSNGRSTNVLVDFDVDAFHEAWMTHVEVAPSTR